MEYKVYTPPYRPQCNGKIGFQKKVVLVNTSWITWNGMSSDLATAAYNFVPNVTSMEAPFFLMFGRHPYMPLNQLMAQARRYLRTEEGTPDLEAL